MHHSLKMIWPGAALVGLLLAQGLAGSQSALAQAPGTNAPWAYLLLDGSTLVDDCLICGRPTIEAPMRGTFNLRLLDQNQLFARYAVENISFSAGTRPYIVQGSGVFLIGGEVGLQQKWSLQLQINDGATTKLCFFTNRFTALDRPWPMLDVTLDQTNGTLIQTYTLRLAVAPVRDIWFSTGISFTSASGQAVNDFSRGDLVSLSGRAVKRNNELTARLGIMPPVPDLGLDAVDILPGGEISFSLEQDAFSETLGPLQHGDLLSSQGRILYRNQDLLAAFMLQPEPADVGLDGVQLLDTGEVLFSIKTNVSSKSLGLTLHNGDLLSSAGEVRRSNQQLLAKFQPSDATRDYGLDAFYVWPHGEIWFSTETDFQDLALGPISAGDLLSDAGYIVFRNHELLSAFATDPQLDFGLDALFVVTDAHAPAPPPRLTGLHADPSTGGIAVNWEGSGRVFQLESAESVTGPFAPLSPILPDLSYQDAVTNHAQRFYRLHQW